MMKADWDDLRVFLALSREGNLSATAKKLGVSHPTIARRVKALETAIGARLFERLPDRFIPTAAGEDLLGDVQAMERAAEAIDRRSAGLADNLSGTVRLSANEAMTAFLARNLPGLRRDIPAVEIELSASHMLANLSRREADLMIREQVPDLASIISRRLGQVAYAVYASPALAEACQNGTCGSGDLAKMTWIGFDDDHTYMPGQAWTHDLLGGHRPALRVNDWLVLQDAARSGVGLAVLPCYLGDAEPNLRRIGGLLKEVTADQWLLVHRDLRALPRVRAVMTALVQLFQEQRAVLCGQSNVKQGNVNQPAFDTDQMKQS